MTATKTMPKTLGGARHRAKPFGRYDDLAPSALLAQLFLGAGWARAALAHGIDGSWWSGADVSSFVRDHRAETLVVYRPFVDEVVGQAPAAIALVVLALQIVAALCLGLNRHVGIGLSASAFLNVQFIAAGAVNPSVFYLALTAVVIAARLERSFAADAPMLRRRCRWAGAVAVALLAPDVRWVAPDAMIEDPALVLLYLVTLWTAVLHLTWPRPQWLATKSTIDLRDEAA